ncbi:MAG: metallophosphoesterase [Deltaproteobacteria bacterium]|nr:metallophosphoesterase [Deltaproteobacteria bacterium]
MLTFILVYFSIYGGVHVYLFWKTQQAFYIQGIGLFALVFFLILMILGPILVLLMDRAGMILPATLLSYVAYFWMGAVLWFLSLGLMKDIFNLLVRIASHFLPSAARFVIPARPGFVAIALIITAACVWGTIEASTIRVRRVTLTTPLLESDSRPLKVAQISDLHLGLLVGRRKLTRVLDLLKENQPDILVSTGDMVDGIAPHLNHLSELFAAFRPPLGKLAVTGNHEYYAGIDDSLKFHRESGFTVLRGQNIEVGAISITGVDDPAGSRMNGTSMTAENAILPQPGHRRFTILLKHRPIIRKASRGRFDLQVSGHAHGGQLFPFNYLVQLRYPMIAGLYPLGGGTALYTSRGTGTWGPPMRLSASPEITIFTIKPVDQQVSAAPGNCKAHGEANRIPGGYSPRCS